MGLDCYGLLYETDELGEEKCVKYMRYLRGPVLDAIEAVSIELPYEHPIYKTTLKNIPSEYPAKRADLGGGYFIILYWI